MQHGYSANTASEAQLATVDIGDGRRFLVIQFKTSEWATIILERDAALRCWVSTQEINAPIDPVSAVTGHLLKTLLPSPVGLLKRSLAIERRANWDLRNELLELKKRIKSKGVGRKRGKRVSRNS